LVGDPTVPLIAKGIVLFGLLALATGSVLGLLQVMPNELKRHLRKAS